MAGFTKSSLWGFYGFLFGDGVDGDSTYNSSYNFPSSDNGAMIYKNFRNLTIGSGAILSVSNPCRGLFIRVNGVLTLNGQISMSQKGCYVPGGGSDFYIVYNDIKIPAASAAGAGRSPLDAAGLPGGDGVDGQCGGGGSGGGYSSWTGGAGAVGCVGGGGAGGSGASHASTSEGSQTLPGIDASPYGEKGGSTVMTYATRGFEGTDGTSRGYSGGGAGGFTAGGSGALRCSGGVLIVLANQIVGSGSLQAVGSNGGNGQEIFTGDPQGVVRVSAGGGSGGGSIVVFYNTSSWGGANNVAGGAGGTLRYKAGGRGGNGSFRAWSTAQLASHTRL